ncbi:flavin monoamine oxidase family protein [Shimia sp.]|uniref:flavin monoamine oxidase family protein n=1 Tax=Shimia sp. TaxID=1954381 RepID=UPI003B8B2392
MLQDDLITDVAIIGGGLAGLTLARHLLHAGVDFQLLEARDRFGGRIKTGHVGAGYYDLGPAWFWPGQPRMAALTLDLGLSIFEQYSEGALCVEDEHGRVARGGGFASMQGSLRVAGGLGGLIVSLADTLPRERLHLQTAATRITKNTVVVHTLEGLRTITAQRIVIALPPRLAQDAIEFEPTLDAETRQIMQNVPTWMAGQAKIVAVYDHPFWRAAGLSGDVMSRRGPMVEIHDASPAEGEPFALFGFVGVPAETRQDQAMLKRASVEQLVNLFGPNAGNPRAVFLKDWAFDANTATKMDHIPVYAHPSYRMPPALKALENHGIFFAGTEVAPSFGGYLEGALEAAGIVARGLTGQNVLTVGATYS